MSYLNKDKTVKVSHFMAKETTMNRKRHIENQILVTGEQVYLNTPENKVGRK